MKQLIMHKLQQKSSYISLFSQKELDTMTDCEVLRVNSHPAFQGWGDGYSNPVRAFAWIISDKGVCFWYSSVWPARHLLIWPTTVSSPLMPVLADTAKCVFRRNNFGDRCFAAAGPCLWNTLPLNLRLCDSLGQFKRLVTLALKRAA